MHANELIKHLEEEKGVTLAEFVAETAIWASPETFALLKQSFPDGCWFPNMRRARNNDPLPEGVRFDRNNYANYAIRQVTGRNGTLDGFSACHIYHDTCYDVRYHTCIANLILAPRALESVTDHFPHVAACLAFRALELYSWWPAEMKKPTKPDRYPQRWQPAVPLSDAIRRKIERRSIAHRKQSELA